MRFVHWILLIGVLHAGFFVIETFFSERAIEQLEPRFATEAPGPGEAGRDMIEALFWNQGVYNAFLAAGLFWAALGWDRSPTSAGRGLAVFFLGCVTIAGVAGLVTVGHPIFLLQALPALLVLVMIVRDHEPRGSAAPQP